MSLVEHLARRIRQVGPMSVADYMIDCLLHRHAVAEINLEELMPWFSL